MRSALEIANWFIENGAGYNITHLKLQKLLYISYGLHYTRRKEALFYDQFEAWKFGPVLQNIYLHLKHAYKATLTRPIEIFGTIPMATDPLVIDTLRLTLDGFGSMTASELVDWTHAEGGPWHQIYDGLNEKQERALRQISPAEITRWFAQHWKDIHPEACKALRSVV